MVALAQNERFLVVKDSRRLVFEHKMTTLSGQKFSSDLKRLPNDVTRCSRGQDVLIPTYYLDTFNIIFPGCCNTTTTT